MTTNTHDWRAEIEENIKILSENVRAACPNIHILISFWSSFSFSFLYKHLQNIYVYFHFHFYLCIIIIITEHTSPHTKEKKKKRKETKLTSPPSFSLSPPFQTEDDDDSSSSDPSKPKTKNFLIPWLQTLEITSAELLSPTTTKITYRFPVTREYLNPMRTFHGGAIAAMFDVCTTWTLFPIADYGFWSTMGTTRSLVCTYVKPVVEGEVVVVECRVS